MHEWNCCTKVIKQLGYIFKVTFLGFLDNRYIHLNGPKLEYPLYFDIQSVAQKIAAHTQTNPIYRIERSKEMQTTGKKVITLVQHQRVPPQLRNIEVVSGHKIVAETRHEIQFLRRKNLTLIPLVSMPVRGIFAP